MKQRVNGNESSNGQVLEKVNRVQTATAGKESGMGEVDMFCRSYNETRSRDEIEHAKGSEGCGSCAGQGDCRKGRRTQHDDIRMF